MTRFAAFAFAGAVAWLGACTDNANQARMEGPTRVAATANEQPEDLFSSAEMQMHARMMGAQGANAAEAWVRKMIEHHRGAVQMSEMLLAQPGIDPAVAEQARKTADDQRRDIERLEAMLQRGVSGAGAPDIYATMEQEMQQRMMAAAAPDAAQSWLRNMIAHHRGAIAMSNAVIAQGGNQQVADMARETIDKQNREIQDMERLLQG